MKDFLNHLEGFIKDYGFYLALALLLVVVIILVVDIFVVASVNKKIKKLEKKLALKKQLSKLSPVKLETTQKITGEKTFTSELKGYPVIIDKKTGALKIVNDRPRDSKGRFVKVNK